ncbi:hypothetical protein GCM10027287_12710 [Bordetella muralis]
MSSLDAGGRRAIAPPGLSHGFGPLAGAEVPYGDCPVLYGPVGLLRDALRLAVSLIDEGDVP